MIDPRSRIEVLQLDQNLWLKTVKMLLELFTPGTQHSVEASVEVSREQRDQQQ